MHRLTARIEELEEALEPFAAEAAQFCYGNETRDYPIGWPLEDADITYTDLARARAALGKEAA